MAENYVVLAVPMFFVLMALEIAIVRWRGLGYYRVGDAINSIACGIIDQLLDALVGLGPGMALYAFAGRLTGWHLDPSKATTWVLSFLCVDFIYYWWHRFNHEINLLWAGHIVHHQSEDYNLSTALRQSWPTGLSSAFFYLPMAVIGIPFQVYFGGIGLMLLYQFWIHTQVIDKLGPLEWVLNTPSHHRVHHGVNPEYVDRNYGGILIVWDRLFGTFAQERAPVVYGTVHPLETWNPVRNNLDFWRELGRRSRAAFGRGWFTVMRPWVVSPEWTESDPHPPLVLKEYRPEGYRKFDVELSRGQLVYVLVLFAVILVSSALFLNFKEALPVWGRFAFVVAAVAGLAHVSSIGRPKPAGAPAPARTAERPEMQPV